VASVLPAAELRVMSTLTNPTFYNPAALRSLGTGRPFATGAYSQEAHVEPGPASATIPSHLSECSAAATDQNGSVAGPSVMYHASERPGEAAKFAALAAEWWDPRGPMAPLHAMNPQRARFVRDAICRCYQLDMQAVRPLEGLRVLDVGCGGGLLSESLARMGASVTGIDLAQQSVEIATEHAARDPSLAGHLTYRAASAEQLLAEGHQFDAVTALEVVEHVADQPGFVASLAGLTSDWGALFVSTLSRTPQAYALAIVAAEYVARILPRGTHDWTQFVTPQELVMMGHDAGVQLETIAGMAYNPLRGSWSMTDDLGVNYIACFHKPGDVKAVQA